MNKNLREVLVRVEYHGQVWFDIRVISDDTFKQVSHPKQTGRDNQQTDGPRPSEEHRV